MNNLTKNLSEHERKKLESIRDKLAKNAETKNVFEALIHNFLQQPHREDFSNFLASLEASGESGLLKVIEEQLDLQGRLLTFDLIKEESISLHDLIEGGGTFSAQALSDDLRNIGPLGEEIEKYLNKVFLDKLQMNIPKPAFAELKQRIHTNDSLSTRCKEIQHFLDECAEETKSLNVSSITINNQSIANHLEKEGKIEKEKIHTLSQTEFKKAMDALVSRTMTPRLNKYAQEYLKLEKDIQNTCQNAFPLLGSIIQQTPFNIKKLRQEDSTLDTKLVQLETSLHSANTKEERDSITAEIQNTHRETYKKEIEKTDPNIAQIVQKLRDNNFDYSTLAPQEMQELIKKTAEQRCKIARERGFTDNLIGEEQKLKTFINDLTDPNKTKIEIDGMIIPITNKQIKTGVNPHFKDINLRAEQDSFPYDFEIDLKRITGNIEENRQIVKDILQQVGNGDQNGEVIQNGKITLPGDKVGIFIPLLLEAYKTGRLKTDEDGLDEKEKEKLQKNKEDLLHLEEAESNKKAFNDARNKLQGYNFENEEKTEAPGFKKGTRLLVPYGESSLPPYETGAQDRLEMNIENINNDEGWFEVKIKGSSLSAGNDFENTTHRLQIHPSVLSNFQKFGTVIKLPDPKNSENPNQHLQKLKNIPFLSKGFSAFDPLEWNDGKKGWLNRFVNSDENKGEKEKVEYFGYQDRSYEGGKPAKNNIVYKVEYSPSSKTFKVSNKGFLDKNEKGDDKYKKRDKEMDYNNFLLFIADHKLQPRKKEEAQEAQERNDQEAMKIWNKKNRKWSFFSRNTIKNVIKGQRKKINDKLDAWQKSQEEKFEDFLLDDVGLHNVLTKTLGWIPSVNNALGELQQERFNEKDNRVRKKIKWYLDIFEADPRFADVFEEQPDFIHTLFGGKSYKQFLVDGFNNTIGFEPPELYIASALLLTNIKSGKSPYRCLSEYENSGLWVKVLLGGKHYDNFLAQKQQLLDDLKSGKANEDQLLDKLAKCEMEYITNTINGIPGGQDRSFGSIESRGEYPSGKPGYIDNPSKNRLSDKFAGELRDRYSAWNSKNAIEEAYGKIVHNDFDFAKNEFDKIKSGRFIVAMANLKKMGTLAKTDGQKKIFKQCMVSTLLSGELNTYGDKSTHKRFYTMARSFNFAPGFFAKNFKHQQYTITLLNKATEGRFEQEINGILAKNKDPENVTLDDFHAMSKNTQVGALNKAIGVRRNEGNNYEKVEKFCSPGGELANTDWTKPENGNLDGIMKDFQKKLFDSSLEDTDKDILENDDLSNDVGLLASKSIVEKRLRYKNGEFLSQNNDPNEIEAKKDFRNKVSRNLNNTTAEVAMKQFLIFFDAMGFSEYQKERVVESIKTARVYKEKAGRPAPTLRDKRNQKMREMGYIREHDWKDILRYTFKGAVIENGGNPPIELDQTLDKFLEVFKKDIEDESSKGEKIISAFGNYNDTKPLRLIGREYYNSLFGSKSEENEWMRDYFEQGGTEEQKKVRQQRQAEKDFFRSNSHLFINEDMRKREKALRDRLKYSSAPKLGTGISEEDLEEISEVA